MSACQLTHALDALLSGSQIFNVKTFGGAKLPGCFEALLRPADDDHLARPMVERHGQCGKPNRARSLDHDHVTPIQTHSLDTMNRSDQSTPCTDHPLGGELIIQLEDRRAGAEIDKLCITSVAVGRFVTVIGDAIGFAIQTAGRLALFFAVETMTASQRGTPRDR